MTTTPKALRKRTVTQAKKSAALIQDAVTLHAKILEEGGVPESSLAAPVAKYETALTVLRTLDALGGDGPADADEIQAREDLRVLVRLVSAQFGPEALQADSPLGRVAARAFPDGVPAPAGPEQGQAQEETA